MAFASAFLTACGNGGSINFTNEDSDNPPPTTSNKPAGFNAVPGSLAYSSGGGYSAKLQANPLKGQTVTAPGGYKATLRFTTRIQ